MASRPNNVSAAAAAAAITPPGSSPTSNLLKNQQTNNISAVSPRVNFMTPPDNGTPSGVNGNSNNGATVLPPGIANSLGGLSALPLALLQQQMVVAAAAGNQQGASLYMYPPGMQPFPCYFPGTPLPYPHHNASGPSGPFSPAATTAALMAAMGVPQPQGAQAMPASPFFPAPLTPVFRFSQPQTQGLQPLPPLTIPAPQSAPGQPGTQPLLNERPAKTSIGVGSDAVLSPPASRLIQQPPLSAANGADPSNSSGISANHPVNTSANNNNPNSTNNALSHIGSLGGSASHPNHSHTGSLASPNKQQHHHQQQQIISSSPGVNSSNNSMRHSPLHDQASNSAKTRKRPPNLTIPISNFDVAPNGGSIVDGTSAWPPSTPGGTNASKTPKTAPSMSNPPTHWPHQRNTPRGGAQNVTPTISSAGARRGRPPLHHRPPISADHAHVGSMNGFPPVSGFSSTSSTYNSPNLIAPQVHSANSFSTGSDMSHHQQDVVINSPSHLLYPDHFKRGSLIRLADGSFKCVEDMSTTDFTRSAQLSGELQLDSSQVLQIEPNATRGAAMLYLAVGDQTPINVRIHVEAPLEHPFFVYNVGWSSCDPERTRIRYGLMVSQLRVGDKCISLTRKPPTVSAMSVSSATATTSVSLPPPPPPPPSHVPMPQRRTGNTSSVSSLASQPLLQAASAAAPLVISVDQANALKSDFSPHKVSISSNSVINNKESEAEMESIATASLLSLQQSKIEAVSPMRSLNSLAVAANGSSSNPNFTVENTAVMESSSDELHHRHHDNPSEEESAPMTPNSNLMIADSASSPDVKNEPSRTEQPSSSVRSPSANITNIVEDQNSVASEPLALSNDDSRAKFHNQRGGTPRLLLFPGKHITSMTSGGFRPGSSSFVGLRRRRHRSTSALALTELSSKVVLLQKDSPSTTNIVSSSNAAMSSGPAVLNDPGDQVTDSSPEMNIVVNDDEMVSSATNGNADESCNVVSSQPPTNDEEEDSSMQVDIINSNSADHSGAPSAFSSNV